MPKFKITYPLRNLIIILGLISLSIGAYLWLTNPKPGQLKDPLLPGDASSAHPGVDPCLKQSNVPGVTCAVLCGSSYPATAPVGSVLNDGKYWLICCPEKYQAYVQDGKAICCPPGYHAEIVNDEVKCVK